MSHRKHNCHVGEPINAPLGGGTGKTYFEIDFGDLELRMISIARHFRDGVLDIVMRPEVYQMFREPEPKPTKKPKHHSHLIEAENRKTRRPRR